MTKAKFLISCENIRQCPTWGLPEIVLIGRSNVGKSTFINTLANHKGLAKTSNTPGKTRLINFFNFDDKFIIVDLPGYGYAKVSQAEQAKWNKNLCDFLLNREEIHTYIQIIDSRHDIQKNDNQMAEWINFNNLSEKTHILLNKCDLIKHADIQKKINLYKNWYPTEIFTFSAKNPRYTENIKKYLQNIE